jgi:hypothetical protein
MVSLAGASAVRPAFAAFVAITTAEAEAAGRKSEDLVAELVRSPRWDGG